MSPPEWPDRFRRFTNSRLYPYSIGLVCVAAATATNLSVYPFTKGASPLLLYALALALAAWAGGVEAGLCATVSGCLAGWFLLNEPRFSFAVQDAGDPIRLVTLLGVGVLVSLAVGRQRELNRRLKHAKERLEMSQRAAKIGTFDWDIASGKSVWSAELERLYGFEPGRYDGTYKTWRQMVLDEDATRVEAIVQSAFSQYLPGAEYDFRAKLPDGSLRWFWGTVTIVYDESVRPRRGYGVTMDVTPQKRIEEDLRRKVEELRTLMDVAPVAIWVANDSACREITGNSTGNAFYEAQPGENVSATTVLGVRRFFKDGVELTAEGLPMQQAARLNREVRDSELEVLLSSGGRFFMTGNASPLRDDRGEVRGAVGAFLDITERKRAEQELRKKTEELARANEDLRHFASAASHDLQEPLRMIACYSEFLAQRYGAGNPEAEQYAGYVRQGVARMRALIDGVLLYSIFANRDSRNARSVDLGTVVTEAIWNLQTSIAESGTEVVRGELPTLIADERQLVQVFQNLIGNAVKYRSPERKPRVRVCATPGPDEWIFCVEDNGIGFDMRYADTIFGMFKRLHSQDQYPGTGIGLAICKRIVEGHAGRIWAESESGIGSKFYFTIPAEVNVTPA